MLRPARLLAPVLVFACALAVPVLSAAPEKWTAAIDKFTAADAVKAPAPGGIVFVGSSSIVKWTSLAEDFAGLPVINRGFGGSELADSVFYADRIVIPYRPKTVVLYAGENDANVGKSVASIHADFRAFVAKVHAALPETKIVYIGLKPSPSRWKHEAKFRELNALIAADCAKNPRLRFVDVWAAMLDAQGQPRPELFVKDMLHMNPAGYAIWKPLVAAALK